MCLRLKFRTREEAEVVKCSPKKAKKDITVYKVLKPSLVKGKLFSPFQYFLWEPGYHYYQDTSNNQPAFTFKIRNLFENFILEVHQGLHAYTSLERAKIAKWSGNKVYKMIIPKGSLYYEDSSKKEIVADNMIFYKQKSL